jgi:hypothetical protein
VPTWAPFRLQFYFNGHNALAAMLRNKGIGFSLLDNAFVQCDDWDVAQALSNGLKPEIIHRILDSVAARYCPVVEKFSPCHWSLMQVEYATDIVLVDLRGLLFTANRRYLDFIAAVDDPTNAMRDLDKLSPPGRKKRP